MGSGSIPPEALKEGSQKSKSIDILHDLFNVDTWRNSGGLVEQSTSKTAKKGGGGGGEYQLL